MGLITRIARKVNPEPPLISTLESKGRVLRSDEQQGLETAAYLAQQAGLEAERARTAAAHAAAVEQAHALLVNAGVSL